MPTLNELRDRAANRRGQIWRHPYRSLSYLAVSFTLVVTLACYAAYQQKDPLHWLLHSESGWIKLGAILFSLLAAYAYICAFRLFKRARVIADTPTANLSSAAQGLIEIVGTAQHWGSSPPYAEYSIDSPVWKNIRELNSFWEYFRDVRVFAVLLFYVYIIWPIMRFGGKSSDDLFILHTTHGDAVIDPDDAEIVPIHSSRDRTHSDFSLMHYIPAGQPIYVFGDLTTHTLEPTQTVESLTREIILRWKRDPENLVARFDSNSDGDLDAEEWNQARTAAKELARMKLQEENPNAGVAHVISKGEGDLPMIISALPENRLLAMLYRGALANFLVSLLAGVAVLGVWWLRTQV